MSLRDRLSNKINKLGRSFDIQRSDISNLDLSGESISTPTTYSEVLFVYEEIGSRNQIEAGGKPIETIEFLAKADTSIIYGDRVVYEKDTLGNPKRLFTVSNINPYLDGKGTIAYECTGTRVVG